MDVASRPTAPLRAPSPSWRHHEGAPGERGQLRSGLRWPAQSPEWRSLCPLCQPLAVCPWELPRPLNLWSLVLNGEGMVLPTRWFGGASPPTSRFLIVSLCLCGCPSQPPRAGGHPSLLELHEVPDPLGLARSKPFSVSKFIFQTGPSPHRTAVSEWWVTSTSPALALFTESQRAAGPPTEGELSSARQGCFIWSRARYASVA